MNTLIETVNQYGRTFLSLAWPMLWQSSLLIIILFALDFLFRRKIRAAIRYAFWLVVLLKLCLPPTLALPTGAAWWLFPAKPVKTPPIPKYVVTYNQSEVAVPMESVPQTMPVFVPPPPKLDGIGWTLVGFGTVSAALAIWLTIRWWQISRKVRRATASDKFTGPLAEIQVQANLRSPLRLKLVEGRMSPAVCGLFRPVILLPRVLVEQLSAGQLRGVLLHEAFHLRRRDVWVNCAQALLQIAYWWHPLLWLANARIRRLREEAVDDAVMLALSGEAESYAPTLLEVAKLALNRPLLSLGLVGIMESRSALRKRIERLVDFRPPRKAGLTFLSLCGIFAFSAIAVPMGQGPASKPDSSPADEAAANSNPVQQDQPQPQIHIKGRFVTVPEGALAEFQRLFISSNTVEGNWVGTIASQDLRPALRTLDAQPGAENLGQTEAVVTSGRHTQMRQMYVMQDINVVTNYAFEENPTNHRGSVVPNMTKIEAGSMLDVVPTVLPDGQTIDLKTIASTLEFFGYADPTGFAASATNSAGQIIHLPVSLPAIELSRASTDIELLDRQTLVLLPQPGQVVFSQPNNEREERVAQHIRQAKEKRGAQVLVVLATVTLVDAAGNPIHPADRLPASGPLLPQSGRPPVGAQTNSDASSPANISPSASDATVNADTIVLSNNLAAAEDKLRAAINAFAETNLVHTGPGREAIFNKLNRWTLDNVSYDHLPLSEVLRNLDEQAKLRDPDKKGINFLISPNPGRTVEVGATTVGGFELPPFPQPTVNPATGLPDSSNSAAEETPVDQVIINLKMNNLRLADLLDAIVIVADHPIKYDVTDYGIVFSSRNPSQPQLYMRTFRVDPNTFYSGLESVSAASLGSIISTNTGGGSGGANGNQNNGAVVGVVNPFSGAGGVRTSGTGGGGGGGGNAQTAVNPPNGGTSTAGGAVGGQEGQGGLRYITQVTLASDVSVKARKFFTRLGVNMLDPPGKSVFFNDRLGLLFVRATESDLDTIERAVDALNNGAPPPVDAQTNSDNSITNAAILVRDGKLLYEMGKLDAAEDKLRAAMQLDPDNVGASYYLNLIQQAKSRREAALLTGQTNLVNTGPGRQAIFNKLNRWTLDNVSYDHLPLSEVLNNLDEQARLRDPDKKGINFLINPNPDRTVEVGATTVGGFTAPAFPQPTLNPATGLPDSSNATAEATPVDQVLINLKMNNVRLADVLDAIVIVADHPIKYDVTDDGIVFASGNPNPPQLYTRTFRVDPNMFYSGLESVSAESFGAINSTSTGGGGAGQGAQGGLRYVTKVPLASGVSVAARSFFTTLGVNMLDPPGKSVFFEEPLDIMFVRATEQDLDTIERAIDALGQVAPQVQIKARFIEVDQPDKNASGFDLFLGSFTNGSIIVNAGREVHASFSFTPSSIPSASNRISPSASDQPLTNVLTGILTDSNFRAVLGALESNNGAENLGQPMAVVTSGRQTQMRATQIITVTNSIHNPLQVEIGPVLDVVPYVLADGYTISLTLIPSLTEFDGYAYATPPPIPNLSGIAGLNVVQLPVVLPQFTVRQVVTTVNVWDNQTVVLSGSINSPPLTTTEKVPFLSDIPVVGTLFTSRSSTTNAIRRNFIIFVTATIVDQAGNRVHSDDELPFAKNTVPAQPAISAQPPH